MDLKPTTTINKTGAQLTGRCLELKLKLQKMRRQYGLKKGQPNRVKGGGTRAPTPPEGQESSSNRLSFMGPRHEASRIMESAPPPAPLQRNHSCLTVCDNPLSSKEVPPMMYSINIPQTSRSTGLCKWNKNNRKVSTPPFKSPASETDRSPTSHHNRPHYSDYYLSPPSKGDICEDTETSSCSSDADSRYFLPANRRGNANEEKDENGMDRGLKNSLTSSPFPLLGNVPDLPLPSMRVNKRDRKGGCDFFKKSAKVQPIETEFHPNPAGSFRPSNSCHPARAILRLSSKGLEPLAVPTMRRHFIGVRIEI